MSLLEPDDDPETRAFFAALEQQMGDVEEPDDVVDVTTLPSHQLSVLVHEFDRRLSEMGELHAAAPKTEAARQLHSRRAALLVELSRRGLR